MPAAWTRPIAGLQAKTHKLILMDEATVEMIVRNRKMFQCPNAWVQLGMSATNCHSYSVYLNNCMLVICSNSWASQLSATPMEGAQWVMANQVYVQVSEPLWVKARGTPPAPDASSSAGQAYACEGAVSQSPRSA